jgi:hypothetical protein
MTLLRPRSNNADVKLRRKGIFSWMIAPLIALVALTGGSRSQSLLEISLTYLQRHGVPCKSVVKVGSSPYGLGEVATCQDGREWVLFWLEDEIAFLHPRTREPYKWDWEVYISYPELYGGLKRAAYDERSATASPLAQ